MWCHQAAPRSTPIQRRALVVTDVLTRNAVLRVDRDADWVFRELHDPKTLMSCVPGGRITKILDARRFEARVVAGVGPFKIAYAGTGHIKDSDSGSRTASLTIAGGAVLYMSFRMTIENTLLSRELVNFIVGDLLGRTVQRMKVQLESSSIPPTGNAW